LHANPSTNETGANGHERASIFRAIAADWRLRRSTVHCTVALLVNDG
jgi:ABC-type uncharacterized transport system fused permease/ATPase subunit